MTAGGLALCLGEQHTEGCTDSLTKLGRLDDIVDIALLCCINGRCALFLPLGLKLLAALLSDLAVPYESNGCLGRKNAYTSCGKCKSHIGTDRLGAKQCECRSVSLAYHNGKLCVLGGCVRVSESCKLGCVSRALSLKAHVKSLAVNERDHRESKAVAEADKLGDSSRGLDIQYSLLLVIGSNNTCGDAAEGSKSKNGVLCIVRVKSGEASVIGYLSKQLGRLVILGEK